MKGQLTTFWEDKDGGGYTYKVDNETLLKRGLHFPWIKDDESIVSGDDRDEFADVQKREMFWL